MFGRKTGMNVRLRVRPGAMEAAGLGQKEPLRPEPGTLSFGGWEVTDWSCGLLPALTA